MDVGQGFSNPYPLKTKISAKFWTFGPFADKWQQIFENIYLKIPENEFLVVYFCIIKLTKFRKSLLFDQRKLRFYRSLGP